MKLFGDVQSPETHTVWLALAEKRAHAAFVAVDCLSGEHKRAAHRARHPFGELPVLEQDDGFRVYEVGAILRYLDLALGGTPLMPEGPRERARMEQWLSVEQSYLRPAVRTLRYAWHLCAQFGDQPDELEVKGALAEACHVFEVLDGALSETDYLAGDSFSLADLVFIPSYQFLLRGARAGDFAARPRVSDWWRRVRERESFAALRRGFARASGCVSAASSACAQYAAQAL